MGLDNDGTKFLFAARAAGVSFRNTATLGRQNFFPEPAQLQRLLDLEKPGLSAKQFLGDSGGYAEKFLEYLGAEEIVALDNSAYEGAAIVTDLNAPIADTLKSRFSAVIDGGCLEHIFNFPQAIKNSMEMLAVGGHFVGITPANNFCGHGFYQFSPELYFRIFSEANGFLVRAILTKEKDRWFRVVDPEEFGGRVELQNNRATYLFVLARKIEEREIFLRPPQQSDYARKWEGGTAEGGLPSGGASCPANIRALLPPRWKEALRPFAANFSIGHRYACYQELAERAVLRGMFGHDQAP
jgi:hypothetical protein